MKSAQQKFTAANALSLRLHKRTVLVALLLVILPWTLLSIPGEVIGGAGSTGVNVCFREHGWPFTHLQSAHYDVSGSWFNGKFVAGKPINIDTKRLVSEQFASFFRSSEREAGFVKFDLRLSRSKHSEQGYWSSRSNWPYFWNEEHHSEICWIGLIGNSVLLLFALFVVSGLSERRIRRGLFFNFPLSFIAGVIVLIAVLLAMLVAEYKAFGADKRSVEQMRQLEEEFSAVCEIRHVGRFSRVVAQLFNGGVIDWGGLPILDVQPFFTRIETRTAYLSIDGQSSEQVEKVVKLANECEVELEVSASEYDHRVQRHLLKLDQCKIVGLDIDFDAYDWIQEIVARDLPRDHSWHEAVEKACVEVNLNMQLPHLKRLSLDLEDVFTAKEQLQPFLNLPRLKELQVHSVDENAADYLLKHHEQWPSNAIFVFSEELPGEMKQQLLHRFPESREGF